MTDHAATTPIDHTHLQHALRAGCRLTGWPIGNAYIASPETEILEPSLAWSLPQAPWAQMFRKAVSKAPVSKGQGIVGKAYAHKRPQWIPDATADGSWPLAGLRTRPRIRAAVALPVAVDGRVEVVLVFWSSQVERIDRSVLAILTRIAQKLATRLRRFRGRTVLPSSSEEASSFSLVPQPPAP